MKKIAIVVLTVVLTTAAIAEVLPGFCGYDTFIPKLPKTGIVDEEFPSGFCGYEIFIPKLTDVKEESDFDIQREEQIQSDKQVENLEKVFN